MDCGQLADPERAGGSLGDDVHDARAAREQDVGGERRERRRRVRAQLRPGLGAVDMLRALFPCGSITGAPKIRAMEIIHEVEAGPRGAYCGAIGWMAPDGSAAFNVAIRTLTVTGDHVSLNVGGGVTQKLCILIADLGDNHRGTGFGIGEGNERPPLDSSRR